MCFFAIWAGKRVLFNSAGGTRLRLEEQLMWSMKTSLMPRTPVITCQGSMFATDTWWFCITMPTG